jgi:D-alanine-D-alanine ligase
MKTDIKGGRVKRADTVAILFGGPGSERRVSVATSRHVAQHLPNASCLFWAPDDSVFEVPRSALLDFETPFSSDFSCASPRRSWESLDALLQDPNDNIGVFFLGLHGDVSENGALQERLEGCGRSFTGSGSASSRLAFDKACAKEEVARHGVQIAPALTIRGANLEAADAALKRMHAERDKVVLKPIADGSSTGLFIIEDRASREQALSWLQQHPDKPHMLEAFIDGVELTVGVIETRQGISVLPCTEVRLDPGRSFDFAGKYLGEGSLEITPAEVSAEITAAAQTMARRAHGILGCFGYSRTDMIVDKNGPVFIETNTLPGLTPASFLPQQLDAANLSMKNFVAEQIELARIRPEKV